MLTREHLASVVEVRTGNVRVCVFRSMCDVYRRGEYVFKNICDVYMCVHVMCM